MAGQALNSHCDSGPASNPIRLKREARAVPRVHHDRGLSTRDGGAMIPQTQNLEAFKKPNIKSCDAGHFPDRMYCGIILRLGFCVRGMS